MELPASLDPSQKVFLVVVVHDKFDAATVFRLPPVQVTTDLKSITDLVDLSQSMSHPLIKLMSNEDQHTAAPIIQSVIQVFDEIREQDLRLFPTSKIESKIWMKNETFRF